MQIIEIRKNEIRLNKIIPRKKFHSTIFEKTTIFTLFRLIANEIIKLVATHSFTYTIFFKCVHTLYHCVNVKIANVKAKQKR